MRKSAWFLRGCRAAPTYTYGTYDSLSGRSKRFQVLARSYKSQVLT